MVFQTLLDPSAFLIVETDASELGYGGILKQKISHDSKEQIVRYHSGIWHAYNKNILPLKKKFFQ